MHQEQLQLQKILSNIHSNINTATPTTSNLGMIGALGATAAATGGGIIAKSRSRKYVFPPKFWNNLSNITRGVIITKLLEVGYSEEDVKNISIGTLKIKVETLDRVYNAIRKAMALDNDFEAKFIQIYNYTIFTEDKKINKYKLLLTMIIDGKNTADNHNIYNLLNRILIGTDYVRYDYSGVDLEEVLYLENTNNKDNKEQE